ncbi:MAG: hypothetical protein ACLFWF_00120 [Alphaproteobacteria bacterium]
MRREKKAAGEQVLREKRRETKEATTAKHNTSSVGSSGQLSFGKCFDHEGIQAAVAVPPALKARDLLCPVLVIKAGA